MRSLMLLAALAACSDTESTPKGEPRSPASSIVGLYERAGIPDEPSRICITGKAGEHRFGLRSSYESPESCMARGRIRQAGSVLTLLIDGDPACALTATVTATGLTLRPPKGPECSYYCGAGAELDGGPFEKVGGTVADGRRAVDLVGEPLC